MNESEKGKSNYSNHNPVVLDSGGEYRILIEEMPSYPSTEVVGKIYLIEARRKH
jgi:hypothetical protein